ncbi:MAG: glycosyltransferase, partial [Bacteroidaceae bacterium]|nr:glycosyltransferase [Bacteroidaceae bacterium]
LTGCHVLHQDSNIGRAAIRNRLYEVSRGDYLLFIDCDAEVVSSDFMERYYNDRKSADVICGALCNPKEQPSGCELRYKYEIAAERAGQRTVSFRMKRPYEMFSTFNVMFRREVFGNILFDDRCTEYGYEDVLMGLRLQEKGFSILHTDNALLHRGINSNDSFLKNTEAGIRTLWRIGEPLLSHSNLALTALRLKRWHLTGAFLFFFKLFKSGIHSNLCSHHPLLLLFKVYKLGYLCELMKGE